MVAICALRNNGQATGPLLRGRWRSRAGLPSDVRCKSPKIYLETQRQLIMHRSHMRVGVRPHDIPWAVYGLVEAVQA
jgi:hypothetical protein